MYELVVKSTTIPWHLLPARRSGPAGLGVRESGAIVATEDQTGAPPSSTLTRSKDIHCCQSIVFNNIIVVKFVEKF
jgi:hypothetical protein